MCYDAGMSEARSDGDSVDTAAVLAASAFKVGDVVEVTHTIYSGLGVIVGHGWIENIQRREGEPSHYLVWNVSSRWSEDWPGIVDIIGPMYGIVERGRSLRAAQEGER
jgi:hypothetical protein